jgi:PAS domain S-box-containing protein
MKRLGFDLPSLPAQMVLSIIALVLVTAAAAGLPAVWLIRSQLERQAWAQVEQGSRAAQALYAAQASRIANLATLTAQRPTLRAMLAQEERASLPAYLRPLQVSAGLDVILVCDAQHQVVAQVGAEVPEALCSGGALPGFQVLVTGQAPQAWLLAAQPIGDGSAEGPTSASPSSRSGRGSAEPENVLVGVKLDDEFVAHMRAQTGLEHTLLIDGQPLTTSLAGERKARPTRGSVPPDGVVQGSLTLDGRPYYTTRFLLPSQGEGGERVHLEAEVALAVADIVAAQRRLAWTLFGSIAVIAALGSLLGAILARRISRPLDRLAAAATALSRGDLDSSVAIPAHIREVGLLAQALEQARIDLQRSLNELRGEKAWTEHLLEAIVEGIVTLDERGRITFFSQGAEQITGWQREQVLNRFCDLVFHPVETAASFSQLIPPPGQRRKISLELADGRQATLAVTGARLTPPATVDARVALVFRDVSEEEAVHRLMGHFLANVAHEFRTPLSALAASVELLLDQAPDLTAGELHNLLTSLHLGILGLQTLVDNLLESASIEAGRFRVSPHPTSLGQIIAEAIRMMQPLLDKHGQRLVVELPVAIPVVRADARRMVQVLVNLLSNASKYGPDEAEITIGAGVSQDWVRVTVSDRGPGVPPEQRGDLFRRFVYPNSQNNKTHYGVGLGLSVVKAVVQAHNGQVGIEDRPGGGSTFWFTLPVEGEA